MEVSSRTQKAFVRGVWVAGAATAVLVLALAHTRAFEWLESGTYDVRARWTADAKKADPQIVIIDIDNASLAALQEKLGRWPWTRRVWTEVIRYVSAGKPRAIGVDIVFGGKESEQVDGEFAGVLKQAGNVVLAFSFLPTNLNEGGGMESEKVELAVLEPFSTSAELGQVYESKENSPHAPLAELARSARALGCINSLPDPDGTTRRVSLAVKFRDRAYSSLAVKVMDTAMKEEHGLAWRRAGNWFDSDFAVHHGKAVPVDDRGRMLLAWHGGSFVYPRLPIWQVICSIYRSQCPNNEHVYPAEYFRDKIVLIGASAAASYDFHPTPFGAEDPGFAVHATGIDNLMNGEAIRPARRWVVAVAVLLMALAGMGLQFRIRSIVAGAAMLMVLLAAFGVAAVWLFGKMHFALPVAAPVIAGVLAYGSSSAVRYATTGRELRRTRGMLDRYIAPQLVSYVMENVDKVNFKGQKLELTILISDIRSFTTMTEKADPEELIQLLDEYLEAMTEIIFKHNGIVDKFIGDGILAYWGAFNPGCNHGEEAAHAALEMIDRVQELNQKWSAEGKNPIAIGIGINTGVVIFGNIGKGKKIEFTVIGDAVNLASRLEGLNKDFKTSIIISAATRERIGRRARVRELGGVKVKGKTIETTVFELQGLEAEMQEAPPVAAKVSV